MVAAVKFELLGPIRGWRLGEEIELGSPQQRAVLAMLLLARGRHVPLNSLIDGLWGPDAPASAIGSMRTYISRLRKDLGQASAPNESALVVSCVGAGYSLQLRAAALDVDAFERLLGCAQTARRAGDPVKAAQLLGSALALWQGTPMVGTPGPYVSSRRAHLSELYIAAMEDKLSADIMADDATPAIPELQALLSDFPFRESVAELLMLALYKSGRQAEALVLFKRVRQRLSEELGVDPGPGLLRMAQRIRGADARSISC